MFLNYDKLHLEVNVWVTDSLVSLRSLCALQCQFVTESTADACLPFMPLSQRTAQSKFSTNACCMEVLGGMTLYSSMISKVSLHCSRLTR